MADFIKWSPVIGSGSTLTSGVVGMTKPQNFKPKATNWERAKLLAEPGGKISSNHSIERQPSKPSPMASRRLALNLSQGLRTRAGLSAAGPLRRGFATPSTVGKTQTTTLKNGLTVSIIPSGQLTANRHESIPSDNVFTRLRPSTPPGPKHPLSACGLTLVLAPRLTRPTALLTSSSIWLSRFVVTCNTRIAGSNMSLGHCQALSAAIGA